MHIQGLHDNISSLRLSHVLEYPIENIAIVFKQRKMNNQFYECILRNICSTDIAFNIIKRLENSNLATSSMNCLFLPDQDELCFYFRENRCSRNISCPWEHVKCNSEGTCPDDCSYGHEGVRNISKVRRGKLSPKNNNISKLL